MLVQVIKNKTTEKQCEMNALQKDDDSNLLKNSKNQGKKLRDIYGFCNSVEYILSKTIELFFLLLFGNSASC
jgi:hypothetical protein